MVGPISQCLIGGNNRQHLAAPSPSMAMVLPLHATGSTSSKRGRKNFVDPCSIAPLKKRRIQVGRICLAVHKCMLEQAKCMLEQAKLLSDD